ncbi:MAG: glycosyltransferase family 2 protein [Planctomycetes bacterium]|nr:glycosyltransferase family 2 protein [Planctomycetota bacterium]
MKTTVIIPTLNRKFTVLKDAVDSLYKQRANTEFSLVIVDQNDAADPELSAYLKDLPGGVKHIRIAEKGLPNARNVGLQNAQESDIVIFCDDDVIISRNFIDNHLKNYSDEKTGAVAGRVFRKDKPPAKNIKKVGSFRHFDANFTDNFDACFRTEIDSLFGCNMSFRREVLEKAGGFDKRFGGTAHLEETDVSLRIKKLGYKLIFDPEAELEHVYAGTGGCRMKNPEDWVYWYCHNYTLLFLRHFNRGFFGIFLAERIARTLLFAIEYRSLSVLDRGIRGIIDGIMKGER